MKHSLGGPKRRNTQKVAFIYDANIQYRMLMFFISAVVFGVY